MDIDSTLDESPRVAVVVIGRNEGDRLKQCLESVLAVNYPARLLEIIYVDSASTDSSASLAQSMGVKTVVLDGPTTAARGRNAGWSSTSAPFVLFLDGDTLLDRDFVKAAIPLVATPSVAGVFGVRSEIDCHGSIYNAVFDLEWCSQPGPTLYFGGDALVRLEALRAVSGYNASLIAGEEPDMCRRMRGFGYTIQRINLPMTLHDLNMHSFRQYWRRCTRTGYAYAEVSSFYRRSNDPLWSRESRKNVVRGVFWSLFPLVALTAVLALQSLLPIVIFVFIASVLCGRTAWKLGRRAINWKQRLGYGVHSHLQQIPILVGQIRYWLFGRSRYKASLIEYKNR